MESQAPHMFMQFVPLLIISLAIGIQSHLLAKEKGRNVTVWMILGLIPILNFFCIWYFVGAANLRLEKKIDELLSRSPK